MNEEEEQRFVDSFFAKTPIKAFSNEYAYSIFILILNDIT